jgi:hypothetical protein
MSYWDILTLYLTFNPFRTSVETVKPLGQRSGTSIYPGPEQCSLAWVFMNEFIDSRPIVTIVNQCKQRNVNPFFFFVLQGVSQFVKVILGPPEQWGLIFMNLKSGGLHETNATVWNSYDNILQFNSASNRYEYQADSLTAICELTV